VDSTPDAEGVPSESEAGSYPLLAWLAEYVGLLQREIFGWRPTTALVLMNLVARRGKNGLVWAGPDTIAQDCGLKRRAVERAMQELKASLWAGRPILILVEGEAPSKPDRARLKQFPGLEAIWSEMTAVSSKTRVRWLNGQVGRVDRPNGRPNPQTAKSCTRSRRDSHPMAPETVQMDGVTPSKWTHETVQMDADHRPGDRPNAQENTPCNAQVNARAEAATPEGVARALPDVHHDQEDQTAPSSGDDTSGTGSEADRREVYRDMVLYPSEVQLALSRCGFTDSVLDAVLRAGFESGISEGRMAEMIVSAATKEKPYPWLRSLMRGAE